MAASYGEGAITYVEYAYALRLGYPVVKVANAGGFYVGPTASNVPPSGDGSPGAAIATICADAAT